MDYIGTPLTYVDNETEHKLVCDIDDRIKMLDNLVELIVFTPRGSFAADPDFGFEYWNHEYSNIRFYDFNFASAAMVPNGLYSEITKKECQDSIRASLATYQPQLKEVDVQIERSIVEPARVRKKKVMPKYDVKVVVTGLLDDGLGTLSPYRKEVMFFMEPTIKQVKF